MSVKDIPIFDQLTDLERLELAGELTASIRDPEALPVPVAHRLELEKRWSEYERNPSAALSQHQFWTQVNALNDPKRTQTTLGQRTDPAGRTFEPSPPREKIP